MVDKGQLFILKSLLFHLELLSNSLSRFLDGHFHLLLFLFHPGHLQRRLGIAFGALIVLERQKLFIVRGFFLPMVLERADRLLRRLLLLHELLEQFAALHRAG
jgi:hypothetical protein